MILYATLDLRLYRIVKINLNSKMMFKQRVLKNSYPTEKFRGVRCRYIFTDRAADGVEEDRREAGVSLSAYERCSKGMLYVPDIYRENGYCWLSAKLKFEL